LAVLILKKLVQKGKAQVAIQCFVFVPIMYLTRPLVFLKVTVEMLLSRDCHISTINLCLDYLRGLACESLVIVITNSRPRRVQQ
jgi:hypothetical protein